MMNQNNVTTQDDLINEYGHSIALLARRMIYDKELACDAIQETWYEIFKSLNSYRGNAKLSTWVYTIAKRTILRISKAERDFTEKDYIALRSLTLNENQSNDHDTALENCYDCISAYCHCLGMDDRISFLFREVLRFSYEEIAKIMDEKEATLRKRISRSKKKMESYLEDDCILYNPNGRCSCPRDKQVKALGLHRAYEKIEKTLSLVKFFDTMEKSYPKKDFWKKNILGCHI